MQLDSLVVEPFVAAFVLAGAAELVAGCFVGDSDVDAAELQLVAARCVELELGLGLASGPAAVRPVFARFDEFAAELVVGGG